MMLSRSLVMLVASLVCVTTMAFGTAAHSLGPAERRFLSFISLLSFESTIDDVRSVVPELTEFRDQGWGNAYASVPVHLFGIDMTAGFSFHQGTLVSHGVSQRALKKATARRIYRAVRRHLASQYGPPAESRGRLRDAHRGVARRSNWTVHGKLVGVYCEKIYDGYQVGWGAQSAE